MTIYRKPGTSLPATKLSSIALLSTLNANGHARPDFLADCKAWGWEAPAGPAKGKMGAFPLPNSGFDAPPEKARPCILVVDDDAFNLDLMESAFDSDYEVLYAAEGMTALDIATDRRPDLILLDVMMPHLDGYEVCMRLKADKRTRDIPVIFVTALGDMSAENRGLELGAVDYIAKPINATAVRARVNNQIKLKWARDKLTEVAALEQTLRNDLEELLQLKSRDQPIQ